MRVGHSRPQVRTHGFSPAWHLHTSAARVSVKLHSVQSLVKAFWREGDRKGGREREREREGERKGGMVGEEEEYQGDLNHSQRKITQCQSVTQLSGPS